MFLIYYLIYILILIYTLLSVYKYKTYTTSN